jgi:hypothetical protein
MTSTAHALVAGAIISRVPDPTTAILLCFVSHFILDSIPHWDFGTNWRMRSKHATGALAIAETLFGITMSYLLFESGVPRITWALAVGASLLPDWLETPWYIFYAHPKKQKPDDHAGIVEKIFYAFYKIPNMFHSKAQLPLGILTQIGAVGFFLYLLK